MKLELEKDASKKCKCHSKIINKHRGAVELELPGASRRFLEVKWGGSAHRDQRGDPCLHPAIRAFELMPTEAKGRDFFPTDGRVDGSLKHSGSGWMHTAGWEWGVGGDLRDWWKRGIYRVKGERVKRRE